MIMTFLITKDVSPTVQDQLMDGLVLEAIHQILITVL